MSTKFYRVKETNFMWEKGAIISDENGGYQAIDELYNHVELGTEYITKKIIENPENAVFFERVYKVDLLTRAVYETKERAKELLAKEFKTQ